MKPTINAVRAVGANYARRALMPFIIIGAAVAVLLLIMGWWLTLQSTWWWLLEAVLILFTLVFICLGVGLFVLLRAVEPALTKKQRQHVKNFVSKLERVAEHVQTPQIIIIFYVVRDTIHPHQGSFIEEVSRDSKTLAPDFAALRREFE